MFDNIDIVELSTTIMSWFFYRTLPRFLAYCVHDDVNDLIKYPEIQDFFVFFCFVGGKNFRTCNSSQHFIN